MATSCTHGYHLVLELSGKSIAEIIESMTADPLYFKIGPVVAQSSGIPGRPAEAVILPGNNLIVFTFRRIRIIGFSFNVRVATQVHLHMAEEQICISYPTSPLISPESAEDQSSLQTLTDRINRVNGTDYDVSSILMKIRINLKSLLEDDGSMTALPLGYRTPSGNAISIHRIELHSINDAQFILLQFKGAGLISQTTDRNAFSSSRRGEKDSAMILSNDCYEKLSGGSPDFSSSYREYPNSLLRIIFEELSKTLLLYKKGLKKQAEFHHTKNKQLTDPAQCGTEEMQKAKVNEPCTF